MVKIEKWCIRRTPKTAYQINKWFTENTGKIYKSTNDWHPDWGRQQPFYSYLHYPLVKSKSPQGRGIFKSPRNGYVEISYIEFNRCILQKKLIKSKWKKPPNFVVVREYMEQ
jgi:hypothetical protein